MKKLSLEKLDSFFEAIASQETLYLPVDTEKGAVYQSGAQAPS